jgi:hypothetical protein
MKLFGNPNSLLRCILRFFIVREEAIITQDLVPCQFYEIGGAFFFAIEIQLFMKPSNFALATKNRCGFLQIC